VFERLLKTARNLPTIPDRALLTLWIVLGALVRLLFLTDKPPWTDEFATMVFSSGNTFATVPLDSFISIDTLLQPLQINPDATAGDVVKRLLYEDNHPPLYFVLARFWMKFFPDDGGYVSLWGARSLPVLFGILAIPLSYFLGTIAFSSRLVGQFCAAMMALSPYAVFSAQEARHYTLAILFVILALLCSIIAARNVFYRKKISDKLVLSWLPVHGFGLLTHYFFSITIVAQALVLFFLLLTQVARKKVQVSNWLRIGLVFVGTAGFWAFWFLAVIPENHGSKMTDWVVRDTKNPLLLLDPVFQLLGTLITMVSLLPVESDSLAIVILSGALMLAFFLYAIPRWKAAWPAVDSFEFRIAVGFLASSIASFFFISYILSMDITKGARYSFAYFPAVILILAVLLARCWRVGQKRFVAIVLLMALVSSICVTANLGYRKYYRPDRLVPVLQENTTDSIAIATHYKSLVQVGEMMGIAREFKKQFPRREVQFLFVSNLEDIKRRSDLGQFSELWLVNLPNPVDVYFDPSLQDLVNLPLCRQVPESFPYAAGYVYRKYVCDR
jgi:uncharacterized membrane protein